MLFMLAEYTTLDAIRFSGHRIEHFEKAFHLRVGARASASAMVLVQ